MTSIAQFARDYEQATTQFLEAVAQVTPENIDLHGPDAWSARQVIHHVADSEAQSYSRLRRLLAEGPEPVIQGYDESAWAASPYLGYAQLPVENSLAVFRAVRAASLDLIRRLDDSDLDLSGVHTESGAYSVRTWMQTYAQHPVEHRGQLLRALEGLA
jgi:uncharacterized damage-inducible protein DinB